MPKTPAAAGQHQRKRQQAGSREHPQGRNRNVLPPGRVVRLSLIGRDGGQDRRRHVLRFGGGLPHGGIRGGLVACRGELERFLGDRGFGGERGAGIQHHRYRDGEPVAELGHGLNGVRPQMAAEHGNVAPQAGVADRGVRPDRADEEFAAYRLPGCLHKQGQGEELLLCQR